MTISIVTISMNQGQFLPAAVDSVLSQRDVDIEYIIVDAGSEDGSREFLKSIVDPRITLILEPDRGPADGLNKGIDASTGSIIGYLNADDIYMEDALREVEAQFGAIPSADVVYGDGWIVDDHDQILRHYESSKWGLLRYVLGATGILQPSTFFRRSAFVAGGGFNATNRTCWDGELLVDMALAGAHFAHVRADWSAFRLHAAGISGSGRLLSQYRTDYARIAHRATRGARLPMLRPVQALGRSWKLLSSPGYLARRVQARRYAGTQMFRGANGYRVERNDPR